jgi:hypothetical protein
MNITKEGMKLFNNTYFLYFILFLAITNVLGYLVTNKLNAIAFFVLVSLLTYQFNKNMSVVLLVALLTTNLLMINGAIREGLENNDLEEENEEEEKLETIDPELKKGLDILKKTDDVEEAKSILEDLEPEGVSSRINQDKRTILDNASTLEEAYANTKEDKLTKEKIVDTMQNMKEEITDMIQGFDFKSLTGLAGLAASFEDEDEDDSFIGHTQKPRLMQKVGTRKFVM